jgi:undecaprenyl phosphate-alpha-L-ara4FN deformylase
MQLGLRVDVDTFRGTRDGVPRLLDAFAARGIKATFFLTLGPDNMGRHLKRLLRPRFLAKMLRSRAASLYGWDILLAGTFWPGRGISKHLAPVLRRVADAGHEIGLHAWDHHYWQSRALRLDVDGLEREIGRGVDAFSQIMGRPPQCSAAAGWVCNERVLEAKEKFGFKYNSDCRGLEIFVPIAQGRRFAPQIPTTLPTYDEVIGQHGVTDGNYNQWLLQQLKPDALNVLAVHAEVEGLARAALFDSFLDHCTTQGVTPVALESLLAQAPAPHADAVAQAPIAGRDGTICWQRSALAH